MFKKLFGALFLRKKKAPQPKPERRPTGRVLPNGSAIQFSDSKPSPHSPLTDPLHPLHYATSLMYGVDDDSRRRSSSHESSHSSHCSGSSWGSSDSGSSSYSSSSDSGSSCSSSCD